jgi:hypothetical protein
MELILERRLAQQRMLACDSTILMERNWKIVLENERGMENQYGYINSSYGCLLCLSSLYLWDVR